jgi:hypothetical protein
MKKTFLISIIILSTFGLFAQTNKTFFFGARASLDFGRFQDRVEITPNVAVKIASKTYIGLGTTVAYYASQSSVYQYNDNMTTESDIKDRTWYWGGEIFLRFIPFENKESFLKNIFLQTSYEAIFGKGVYEDQSGKYNYDIDNYTPFWGIGYKQPLSEKLSLGMSLNFKLNNETDSPYSNPMIRIAIEF